MMRHKYQSLHNSAEEYSQHRGGKPITSIVRSQGDPDWSKVKTIKIPVKEGQGFYAAIRAAGWPKGGKYDSLIIRKVKSDYGEVLTREGYWNDEVDATVEIPSYESFVETKGQKKAYPKKAAAKDKKEKERREKISDHYYDTNVNANRASVLEVYDSNAVLRDEKGVKQTDEQGKELKIPEGTLVNVIRFAYYDGNSKMIAKVQHAHTGEVLGWTHVENLESRSFMMVSEFRSQMGGKQPARITGKAGCRQGASDMLITHVGSKEDNECWLNETGLRNTVNGVEYDLKVGKGVYAENGNYFRLLEEDKSFRSQTTEQKKFKKEDWLKDHKQGAEAIAYIDEYLAKEIPVEAGVDHTYNTDKRVNHGRKSLKTGMGYNDGTTDHYIVLTGRGVTTEGKRWYTFFDPRTRYVSGGTALKNILYETDNRRFECRNGGGGRNWYHLSLIIIFPTDQNTYWHVINENRKLFNNGKLIDPDK